MELNISLMRRQGLMIVTQSMAIQIRSGSWAVGMYKFQMICADCAEA